jgi:hypothetical protein
MHRIRVAWLGIVLLTIAVGFRSEIGTAFPARILHRINRKLLSRSASPSESTPSSSVLWSADMETGDLSQWSSPDIPDGPHAGGGVFDTGAATASVDVVSLAHSGIHSAKLHINTSSAPGTSATSGARLLRWLEPETQSDLYYSLWLYFPQRNTPTGNPPWWNVLQWKSKRGDFNDPFFALNVANQPDGSMYFYLFNQQSKTSYSPPGKTIPDGRWFRMEAFYKCAGDNTGHVTLWQDGEQLFDVRDVQTRYADGTCEWSLNNYSNGLNPPSATIHVDDVAICSGGRCP